VILGLLGFPISHSLSPKLYQEILGNDVRYDLLEYPFANQVPSLNELGKTYSGINITTPYKDHFIREVEFEIEAFADLGIINAISFVDGRVFATNTDYIAVEFILSRYQSQYSQLKVLLLGSGAMARMTEVIASSLDIPLIQFSRNLGFDLSTIDLGLYQDQNTQTLVINATSRKFTFTGKLNPSFIFWDYNYSYLADPLHISRQVKEYQDGQEMLKLQAIAAVEFWKRTNPKLKY
jgi:shikimate dehydrogenase